MKSCKLLHLSLIALAVGACSSPKTQTMKIAIPLSQSLSGYTSMAVHFDPGQEAFQEGLDEFKPIAMRAIQAAGVAASVSEVATLTPPPATDLLLTIKVHDYLKSNAGIWVRGGLADQAKIIVEVTLTDVKSRQVLTGGAVGAWTFDNESNEEVAERAADDLQRFLKQQPVAATNGSATASTSTPAAGGKCIAMCKTVHDGCVAAADGMDPGMAGMIRNACESTFAECNADPNEICVPVRDGCLQGIAASVTAGTIAGGSPEETGGNEACEQVYKDCLITPCES